MIRNVFRTILVSLTPEQAYAIWSDFQNYPRFLPDVKHVVVEQDTLRCRMLQGDDHIEWDAELVELSPHRRIAMHHRNGERRMVISIRAVDDLQTEVSLGAEFNDAPGEPDLTRDRFDRYLASFKDYAGRYPMTDGDGSGLSFNAWT